MEMDADEGNCAVSGDFLSGFASFLLSCLAF
jgi:hypothetical protein